MNQLNGSTFYVDTAFNGDASQDYVKKQLLVSWILVTATAANGMVVLGDASSGATAKIDLRVPVSGETRMFHFRGMNALFPNGVRVISITNANATIGLTNSGS